VHYDQKLQPLSRAAAAAAVGAAVSLLFGIRPEIPAFLAAVGAALPALADRAPRRALAVPQQPRLSGVKVAALALLGPPALMYLIHPGGARQATPAALAEPLGFAILAILAAYLAGLAFRKFHRLRYAEHDVVAAAPLPAAALVLGQESLAWVAAGYGIHLVMDAVSDQGVVFWGRRYAARLIPSSSWAAGLAVLVFGSAAALLLRPEIAGWREALPAIFAGRYLDPAALIASIAWTCAIATVIFSAARRRRRTTALVWPLQGAENLCAREARIHVDMHPSWLRAMPFLPLIAVWKVNDHGQLGAAVIAVEPGRGQGPWLVAGNLAVTIGAPVPLNVTRYGPAGPSDAWAGARLVVPTIFTQGHTVDLLVTAVREASGRGHRVVSALHLAKAVYLTTGRPEPGWVEGELSLLPAATSLPPHTALPLGPDAVHVLAIAHREAARARSPEGVFWKHVLMALMGFRGYPGAAHIRRDPAFDMADLRDQLARVRDPDPQIVAYSHPEDQRPTQDASSAQRSEQGRSESAEQPRLQSRKGTSAPDVPESEYSPWTYKGDPLRDMCTDLVEQAKRHELPPVIGREAEFEQMLRTLLKAERPNPVLVGEAGTGKTAVVHLLAHKLARERSSLPARLRRLRLFELNVGMLEANTGLRGSFEARLATLISQLEANRDVVLFIDEIHLLVGAGQAEMGAVAGAGQRLKPALSSGRIRVIGATTPAEYRVIEKDPALDRRFHPVPIDEPAPDLVKQSMMPAIVQHLSKHHGVTIAHDAVETAVDLTVRYVPDKRLPAKAKEVLDAACAGAALRGDRVVTAAEIRKQIELDTKIPVQLPTEQEAAGIRKLADSLTARVFGQREAVWEVASAILRYRSGLGDERKPIGVFLFYGPTGVGKTELAKAAAAELFGSERAMVRLDMSEFYDRHTVSRLIGAPPGYMGHEDGGQLTEPVRKKRHCVVLLDEIEKADPAVLTTFLQLFDDGRLTDGAGRTVDFTHTLIIMTSNLGAEAWRGITPDDAEGLRGAAEQSLAHLRAALRPEFFNRLRAVPFWPLPKEVVERIAKGIVVDVVEKAHARLAQMKRAVDIQVDPAVYAWLADAGFTPELGARPMRRLVESTVINQLAEYVLAETSGSCVRIALASPSGPEIVPG
jgi:ATP-dependent Clp protease ATP-binding subunit ClpC